MAFHTDDLPPIDIDVKTEVRRERFIEAAWLTMLAISYIAGLCWLVWWRP